MLTLHTLTNKFCDGENYHQFLQINRQPLLDSMALGEKCTLGEFLSDNIIGALDIKADKTNRRLEGLRQHGLIDRLLAAAQRINMKGRPAGTDDFDTYFGEWEYDSLVIQEPTLRELQEDVWASDPEFPKEDWKSEVERDETHQGYWEWVESQREQDDRHFLIRYNQDGTLFWSLDVFQGSGEGYTDYAHATRFSGSERFNFNLPEGGEWVLENDVIPWKVGDKVLWTDPDNSYCTRTGVIAFIAALGEGRLAVSMEDGWEADVMATELSHEEE